VSEALYDSMVAAWDSKYTFMRQHASDIDPAVTTVIAPKASPSYRRHCRHRTGLSVSGSGGDAEPDGGPGGTVASHSRSGVPQRRASGDELRQSRRVEPGIHRFVPSHSRRMEQPQSRSPPGGLVGFLGAHRGNQFRPAPPPAFGSNAETAQYALSDAVRRQELDADQHH
jgi:hypothetical protein